MSPAKLVMAVGVIAALAACGGSSGASATSPAHPGEHPTRLREIAPSYMAAAWNLVLTTSPSDAGEATVSRQTAEQTALRAYPLPQPPASRVRQSILALARGRNGKPTMGHLIWVIDISPSSPFYALGGGPAPPLITPPGYTPPPPEFDMYLIALVDAKTGQLGGVYWG